MQSPRASSVAEFLAQDRGAAIATIKIRPERVKADLDRLLERFDASVRSARDVPQQRNVEYDSTALDQGLRLASLYAEAIGDDRPIRLFKARKERIDGTVLLNERKYPAALAKLSAALEEATKLGDVWLQIITLTNEAYAHLELGNLPDALHECEQASTLAEHDTARARALAAINLASVRMHEGRFDLGAPLAKHAAELAHAIGNRLWEGNALLDLGIAYRQLGQVDQASVTLMSARKVLLTTQDKLGIGRTFYALALLEGDQGDYRSAAGDMERALPIIINVDIRHSHDIPVEGPHASNPHNPIQETALDLLVRWQSALGNQEKSREYATTLAALKASQSKDASGPDGDHVHTCPGCP
jgi:tetratricopeptide (TPR) repeat protein